MLKKGIVNIFLCLSRGRMDKALILWYIIGGVISVVGIIYSNNPIFYLFLGFLFGFMIARLKGGNEE